MANKMSEKKLAAYNAWKARKRAARARVMAFVEANRKELGPIARDIEYSLGGTSDSPVGRIGRTAGPNEILQMLEAAGSKGVTLSKIFDKFEIGKPEMALKIRDFILKQKVWVDYDASSKTYKVVGTGTEPAGWTGYRPKAKDEVAEGDL